MSTQPKDVLENVEKVATQAALAAMETNNFATKEDIQNIPTIETNNFATKEDIQLVTQQLQGMETNSRSKTELPTITTIKEALDVMEVNSLINNREGIVEMEFNNASTYTPSVGADSAPGREDRQMEIEYDPLQMSLAPMLMQRTGTGAAYRLSTKTAGVSNAGTKAHGAAFGRTTKSVSDEYVQYQIIGHILTVPKEDLNDTDRLQGYFEEELMEESVEALNSQILTGDGTGSNVKGITAWSPAKTQSTFETFFGGLADDYGTQGNEIDVIVAAKQSLRTLNFGMNGNGFKAFVSPEFKAKVEGLKSTTGDYVLRTAFDPAGMERSYLSGVEIVDNSAVPADTFYMFHDSALKFVTRQGFGSEVGYTGDDWERNNTSIKSYGRFAVVSGKPSGIVNGTFANAILALNA